MEVNVVLENGERITASTEEWLVALIFALPPSLRAGVVERVRTQLPFKAGPRNYVLKAEPIRLGIKL